MDWRRPCAGASLVVSLAGAAPAADWPGWRGPRGDGRSDETEVPARWGPKEGVAWRVEVPGTAHSSPIVVGDAVFITTAAGDGKDARRLLRRYHRHHGRLVWEREIVRAPREGKHFKNSHASGTPASDGERVFTAFFASGKVHVAAVGLDGSPRWEATPCGFRSMHGFCSSPVLHEELAIVNCDQDSDEAAIYAFERESGKVRWRTERENHVRSYVTPLIAQVDGKPQLFISGSQCVTAYDPGSGRRLWVCDGPTEQCVASPVFGEGLVFITGGYPGREILAIRPDGRGDVSRSHVAWKARKGVAYVPSPLFAGGRFYVVHDETGVLSAYDARTGKLDWQERLGGKFSSSLTLAAGRIYLASEDGDVHVVAPGPRFERLALNRMGEGIFASPAVADGRIYLRTTKALYAIGPRQVAAGEPEPVEPSTGSENPGDGAGPDEPAAFAASLRVLEPGALPPDQRLGKPRDLNGYHPWKPITDPAAWKERARKLREQILVAAGLWPLPEPAPLDPVVHGKIDRGDYTVEKVYFPSYPGFYVTGNLYRPKAGAGRRPAVLSPHGHWKDGRFYERPEKEVEEQIKAGKEKSPEGARYPLQARCAQLARMGCVVFFYDMVGNADSKQIPHAQGFRDAEAELRLQSAFGLQTYNSIRALDFLSGLPDVDPARIGVTGASGGGTQTFFLCAVDDRPAVAFPAVMVSTGMQGGCVCENASCLRVGTGNIEIAALAAPRPLGMTGADDWTIDIETKGLPELKALYTALGAPDRVMAKCYPQFEHNYNQVSRELMYGWMNRHLALGFEEPVRERPFEPVPPAELSVFDDAHPRPAGAADAAGLRKTLTEIARRQMEALRPRDEPSLKEFQRVVGTALRVILGTELPASKDVEARKVGEAPGTAEGTRFTVERLILSRRESGEAVPAVVLLPERFSGTLVVGVHREGKASLAAPSGEIGPNVAQRLGRGVAHLFLDPFLTGEYHRPDSPTQPHTVRADYAGYTFGYNRTLLGQRVHDVLTAVAYARGREGVKRVHLLGAKSGGVWALLARALAGAAVDRAALNLEGFSFEAVKETGDEMMLPGALKYGGLPAFAAVCAPGELWLTSPPEGMELAREAFRAAGAPERLKLDSSPQGGVSALLDWLGD